MAISAKFGVPIPKSDDMAARPIFEARLLGTPAKEVGGISGAEGAASVGLGGVV